MPIRQLPPLLVNQIAAGEVIERPASVVKELVENSLDAGADRIEIAVQDGGRELIRISDNGGGIVAQELPLAVAPHATSKLQTSEQLAAIATLGFRGEALASIASVSRLRLGSRATTAGRAAEAGATLEAAGDQVGAVTPTACAPGTVIEVRDLFCNTPARRKFLRSASTEFGHITEIVNRIALVRHTVGFTLTHNGRSVLDLPATTARRQRCVEVLGKELDEALLEFSEGYGAALATRSAPPAGIALWGLAGLPAIARATSKFQYLCLNGRPIRDRNLGHAIKEAYRGLIAPDLQPVAVVFLEVPFDAVDVNVHPAKAEVRFGDPASLHGLVLTALRQRLLGADLTPKASVGFAGLRLGELSQAGDADHSSPALNPQPLPGNNPSAVQSFVDYFKHMAPQQKGFAFEEVKRALAEENPTLLTSTVFASAAPLPSANLKPINILQVHQSYVVTQDDSGLLIIDQHALHERIMFEELRQRILSQGRLESQRLLMPAVVNASPRRLALLEQIKPLLERLGIEADPLGPNAVGIQAFPNFLFDRHVDPAEFLEELLDKAEEGEWAEQSQRESGQSESPTTDHRPPISALVSESVLHKVLDMMSCKAAVKAGDKLTPDELAALLAKREEIERSSSCPHGRPTTLRLTLRDLEKQFKRG